MKARAPYFFSGTCDEVKHNILNLLRFTEGKLPVKYFGVPLISTRLKREHCTVLDNKICSHINSWTAKCLSYDGRLQLVISIL